MAESKRKPRYSIDELQILAQEVNTHKNILFGKFSDVLSMEKKQKAWAEITRCINAVSQTVRTVDDIRKKWNDWSSVTKGKAAKRRQSLNKTGSGQPDTKPLTELEELVVSIIGETAVGGFKGGIDTALVSEEADFCADEGKLESSSYDHAKPESYDHAKPEHSLILTRHLQYPVCLSSSSIDLSCDENPDCLDNISCANKPTKTIPFKKRKVVATASAESYETDVTSIEREKLKIDNARLETEEKRLEIEQQRLKIEQQRLQVETDILNILLCQGQYSSRASSQYPAQNLGHDNSTSFFRL
ncbi:myb/SANT-like DNA-binding domain-containing protein 4 [Ruditapes philippinarum]|uniref:myb/SANT-like DNA-binding domain-containing protein 4 n=1 Tax=Ruditapes philippinarum TaxID=129788 RepID=UPI00295AE0E2|nr:myb/SANT-like DNA-binding domain-containing protein 4 [Ruditapes philippinarum]